MDKKDMLNSVLEAFKVTLELKIQYKGIFEWMRQSGVINEIPLHPRTELMLKLTSVAMEDAMKTNDFMAMLANVQNKLREDINDTFGNDSFSGTIDIKSEEE